MEPSLMRHGSSEYAVNCKLHFSQGSLHFDP
jgi:hypothetical protein